MRYMAFVKGPENEAPPPQAMVDAMDKYIAEQSQAGIFLDGGGLSPTAESARVRIQSGKVRVIEGPFTESKEVIGGYAVLQYNSWEEALAGAKEFMQLHIDLWPGWEGECEIRQIVE